MGGGASRPGNGGDGGELHFSHCSGVFSDGNFTYIVEPREMAGPLENTQVSPSPSPPKALPARHPSGCHLSGCGCLITPLPPASALVTSASLPSAATPALVPSSYAPPAPMSPLSSK